MKPGLTCSILSFDYQDFDVYLNTRLFYRLAGFRVQTSLSYSSLDLLVILRGIPPHPAPEFSGVLHVFDYVRELSVDYSLYFPNASEIIYISLSSPAHLRPSDRYVYGYVPVFPAIWLHPRASITIDSPPVHIANYKPMNDDPYQKQLITLIQNRCVNVFGAKWERTNIKAMPLSYLSANSLLSKSSICFGLMYPYQRGKSLSGRMWQAPIQGCLVISEAATNIFDCPGIIEATHFSSGLFLSNPKPLILSLQASNFWSNKTLILADDLKLSLDLGRLPFEVFYSRVLLLHQHLSFCWKNYIILPVLLAFSIFKSRSRSFVKKLLNSSRAF